MRLFLAPWSTNCERVLLALAHKGVEFERVTIGYDDRSPVEAVSGQGLVPVADFGDEVVHDSHAILRELERRHPEPALWPAHTALAAEVDLFLEWFDRVWKIAPNAIEDELAVARHRRVPELAAEMAAHLDLFEGLLAGRDHLLGPLTAADLVAYPFLRYAAGRDPADDELFHVVLDEHQSTEGRPALAAWIDRMDALPR